MRGIVRATLVTVIAVALALPAPIATSGPPPQPGATTIFVPRTLAGARWAAPGTSASLTLRPTHVAFSWRGPEGSAVAFRTTSPSGGRSGWTLAPEAHDLATRTRHFSGVISVDRPVAVAWRDVSARGRARAVRIDYMNTLDGPRVAVPLSQSDQRRAQVPQVVTRAQWGADESIKKTTGDCRRRFYRLQTMFVHHTAGSNFDDDPEATMRAIYWYHTVSRGWCDIGYNFVISPDGTIYEGRWARAYRPWETHTSENNAGQVVAGGHVANFNSGTVGISIMGNYSEIDAPPEARRSLAELLAWEADRHDLDPQARHTYVNPETGLRKRLSVISGHRDAGSTACPGGRLYRSLDEVRRDSADVMGDGKANSSITLDASPGRIHHGEAVTYSGALTTRNDEPLPNLPVKMYVQEGSAEWRLEAELTTGVDGSFGYVMSPRANVAAVAVYEGGPSRWGAQSDQIDTPVRPVVTIVPEGGTPDVVGQTHFPPGTRGVTLSGTVDPSHPDESVVVKIVEVASDGTTLEVVKRERRLDDASAYRLWFRIPEGTGQRTFRAVARFWKDDDHAASRSAPATFIIDG